MTTTKTTPMMAQWNECKKSAKDALLLFRLGDFYEAFYDDAVKLSELVDVTLTKRQEIPMAGVPVHTIEQYLERLIAKKMVVAIAEQVEDPKDVKGIVARKVTQVISPATYIPASSPQGSENNFFASISQINAFIGLCFIDLSTAELTVLEVEDMKSAYDELIKRAPKELLLSTKLAKKQSSFIQQLEQGLDIKIHIREDYAFDFENAMRRVGAHFGIQTLDGFGLKGLNAATCATGALFSHIEDDLYLSLESITHINRESLSGYMAIDHTTLRHLEVTQSAQGGEEHTLLNLMDETQTAMGKRLLKSWITHPLIQVDKIQERQEVVAELLADESLLLDLKKTLKGIKDLQRLCMKIESKRINPKELLAYLQSLEAIPLIQALTQSLQSALFQEIALDLTDTRELTGIIREAISDDPPVKLSAGNVIREGYNGQLDELRSLKRGSQTYLSDYQSRLREELDIKSLKVSFNRAFGYYIEVSKGQAHRMPDSFNKRQTLVNSERFISEQLKEFEGKILGAEAQIEVLEQNLYDNLLDVLKHHTAAIYDMSKAIANLDCLLSLALVARENNFYRPLVDNSSTLYIDQGRHPIIEKTLVDSSFIANNTQLDENEKMMMITGPNMAGKSTYIRQVALITLMAQVGSFVPADSAHIGVIERLFTRIGASDDLSRGLSTFMVEMSETASILNQKCPNSLIILDEIGRGTSTYDGIAIAWAVAHSLISPLATAPKTLFATHYFELTAIEQELAGVKNYRVAVQEAEDQVLFLRKIVQGAADKSYGIHVAKLAGIPHQVIQKARQLLSSFEATPAMPTAQPSSEELFEEDDQLFLFEPSQQSKNERNAIIKEIQTLDINEMTPLQALLLLQEYQDRI